MMPHVVYLLGPQGSVSSYAARRFLSAYRLRFCNSFKALFLKFRSGELVFVPVQNKIIGNIVAALKFGKGRGIHCLRLVRFEVRLSLIAMGKIGLSQVEIVYAPPEALLQCNRFIKAKLGHVKIVLTGTTGVAIKKIVQSSGKNIAGIAFAEVARDFKLHTLARNIQDDPDDWTEFQLLRLKK